MARYRKDYTGMRNGKLVATKLDVGKKWWFKCDCGSTKSLRASFVLNDKRVTDCGCLNRKRTSHTTHGMTDAFEFSCWSSMKTRCLNKNHVKYADYGGRGITVDPAWLGKTGFAQFYKDMGAAPSKKHSIERTNGDRGYNRTNCYWATWTEQARNKRPQRNSKSDRNGVTWSNDRAIWEVRLGTKYIGSSPDLHIAKQLRDDAEALYWTGDGDIEQHHALPRPYKSNTTGVSGVAYYKAGASYEVTLNRKYVGRAKDFFEACCIRKSAEIKSG